MIKSTCGMFFVMSIMTLIEFPPLAHDIFSGNSIVCCTVVRLMKRVGSTVYWIGGSSSFLSFIPYSPSWMSLAAIRKHAYPPSNSAFNSYSERMKFLFSNRKVIDFYHRVDVVIHTSFDHIC